MKLIILIPFIYQRAQHQSCLRRTEYKKNIQKNKLGINWWKIKEKITLTTWFIIKKRKRKPKKFPYAEKLRTITLSLLLATDVNNMFFCCILLLPWTLFLGTATNQKK